MKSLYQKYLESIKKWIGKILDIDKKWNNQCVDFIRQYAQDLGYPITTYGNAKEFAVKGLGPNWVKVKEPQVCDIVVFPNGTYGHIAVVKSLNGKALSVYDQNRDGRAFINNNKNNFGTPVSLTTYITKGNEVYFRPQEQKDTKGKRFTKPLL